MDITALVRAIEARSDDDAFAIRLDSTDWQQLATILERRELSAGELLLRRGDTEECAYVVERGRLQVFVIGGPPRSHRIATLSEGTLIGEPGLFATAPRMAHVEAMTSCVVWALGSRQLRAMAAEAPLIVLEVMRAAGALMAARMRANLERGIPVT